MGFAIFVVGWIAIIYFVWKFVRVIWYGDSYDA